MALILIVGFGSAIGAVLRHLYVENTKTFFKYFTSVVQLNIIGSFLVGILSGLSIQNPFVTTGILSGFTTFSTMIVQGYSFRRNSTIYFFIMFVIGLAATILGLLIGEAIHG
ncbi:MAG: CrcB family protein [Lactobacillaceae bacterium]|jgi:CrcB protein|nr:CrcB family protein [Lactobacillaceae bacterium]